MMWLWHNCLNEVFLLKIEQHLNTHRWVGGLNAFYKVDKLYIQGEVFFSVFNAWAVLFSIRWKKYGITRPFI